MKMQGKDKIWGFWPEWQGKEKILRISQK